MADLSKGLRWKRVLELTAAEEALGGPAAAGAHPGGGRRSRGSPRFAELRPGAGLAPARRRGGRAAMPRTGTEPPQRRLARALFAYVRTAGNTFAKPPRCFPQFIRYRNFGVKQRVACGWCGWPKRTSYSWRTSYSYGTSAEYLRADYRAKNGSRVKMIAQANLHA